MERTKENISVAIREVTTIDGTIQELRNNVSERLAFIDFHTLLFPVSGVLKVNDEKHTTNSYLIKFETRHEVQATHTLFKLSDTNGLKHVTSMSCDRSALKIVDGKGYLSLHDIHRHYFNSYSIYEMYFLNEESIKVHSYA